MHALPVPDSGRAISCQNEQSYLQPHSQGLPSLASWGVKRRDPGNEVVVPRLHDIGTSFRTRVKISLQYSDRGELKPV